MTLKQFFNDFLAGFMTPVRLFLKWCNWMGVVVFGFIWTVIKFTMFALDTLYDQILLMGPMYDSIGEVVSGNNPSGIGLFLVTVNTFFPLDLVIAYLSILIQLWIFWIAYRFIKSWIPTLT